MIVHVAKGGKDAAGFTRYLFGPGRANEHTNPHMITGSPDLAGEWADANLTMAEATHLGRVVEAAWRRQYAPALALAGIAEGGVSTLNLRSDVDERVEGRRTEDGSAGAVREDPLGPQQEHVFHAVMSLKADDDPFTDQQWSQLAEAYMRELGFVGQEGRKDASWYAVHHGRSAEGNDHIHIVACTTRPDGTKVDLHNSGRRSQTIRRDILEKFEFVTPLHQENRAQQTPRLENYTAAEHNIARERVARGERDTTTPDRVLLQRILRAAASTSRTEADFINNVLASSNRVQRAAGETDQKRVGLEIEAARWKPGTNKQEVTGYQVRFADMYASDGHGGRQKMWFSASRLSRDLTLSKLRPGWQAAETDASRSYARALWAEQAALAKRAAPEAATALDTAAAELEAVNDALTRLDPHDAAAWGHVEAAAAGATAVVATATPTGADEQGRATGFSVDAGRASDVLTRQWLADNFHQQAGAAPQVPTGLSRMEVATRHLQIAARATRTDRHQGWLAVLQQLTRTVNAIADAKRARGEHVAAATLQRDAVTAMNRLNTWLGPRALSPAAMAARQASGYGPDAGRDLSRAPGTPGARHGHVPPPTTPRPRRNGPDPGSSRGPKKG